MKKLLQRTYIFVIVLVSTFAMTACDTDDWWTRETVSGTWRIVEATPYSGECPYRYKDYMEFLYEGTFYAYGDFGLDESGYWDVSRDIITIDFDGDGRSDIAAQIVQLDDYYMVLDVTDYSFNSDYTLRLVRY